MHRKTMIVSLIVTLIVTLLVTLIVAVIVERKIGLKWQVEQETNVISFCI